MPGAWITSRKPCELIPTSAFATGTFRNTNLVEDLVADADVVVHFAAETHVPRSVHDTVSFFETDVLGTQSVVGAVVKHPIERFIHISSSENLRNGGIRPYDRRTSPEPDDSLR